MEAVQYTHTWFHSGLRLLSMTSVLFFTPEEEDADGKEAREDRQEYRASKVRVKKNARE